MRGCPIVLKHFCHITGCVNIRELAELVQPCIQALFCLPFDPFDKPFDKLRGRLRTGRLRTNGSIIYISSCARRAQDEIQKK
jgi:hypothetical protein